MTKINLNRYTLFASYLPGLINFIPFTLIYFFGTLKYSDYSISDYVVSLSFIMGFSMTFIMTYFFSIMTKGLGTQLENRYFKNKNGFPTSYLMSFNNNLLPTQTKINYRKKIKIDYKLNLLNSDEEKNEPLEARGILNQASKLLSTKYQQNNQVKDANINYGFVRNLSGGLFISIPFSIASIFFGYFLNDNRLLFWSSVLTLVYILIAIFHKKWLIINAEKYAEKLFSIYFLDK